MRRDAFENRQHLSSEIFSPNAKATDAHRCSSTSGFKTIRLPLKDPKQLRPQFLFFFFKPQKFTKNHTGYIYEFIFVWILARKIEYFVDVVFLFNGNFRLPKLSAAKVVLQIRHIIGQLFLREFIWNLMMLSWQYGCSVDHLSLFGK